MDLLPEEAVITEIEAKSKRDFLLAVSKILAKSCSSFKENEIFQVLMEREELGSTGVGGGIAIPHGKLPSDRFESRPNKMPVLLFARSMRGIDFDAMDSKPVYLFFVLLAPEDSANLNLKVLAKIAKLLKNEELKIKLREAKTKGEILEIIRSCDNNNLSE